MAFFDKKSNAPMLPAGVAECDRKIQEGERKKQSLLLAIGRTFVENNSPESVAGTPYEEYLLQIYELNEEKQELEKQKLTIQHLRKCEKCGNILPIDSAFCNKCGERLDLPQEAGQDSASAAAAAGNHCPKCGTEYEAGAAFCMNCGYKLQ